MSPQNVFPIGNATLLAFSVITRNGSVLKQTSMWSRLPKKHKILVACAIPAAFLLNYIIGATQDIGQLTDQLEKGTLEQQVQAAQKLGAMGSAARGGTSALVRAATDPEAELRAAAISALIRVDKNAAVEALSGALTARDSAVRLDAAEALERINSPEAAAVLSAYNRKTEARYQRASYGGVIEQIRRGYQRKEKDQYKRHKRIYRE
ncbi:MAG TPA: HEAT repeat domain-containing protein [Oligoflexia bacterium]|nr:HEAT repeat domain-containing protein [Oligoflexia bacterium]